MDISDWSSAVCPSDLIVIGEARAKTRLGFQKGDALDRLPAGEVGARHEHQIALPQPQTAAMDEQVADGDLARYPRVVHAKPGHMVDNRIVPPDLALVDEDGERRGGHRLAGRAGLEQGLRIDRRRVAEPARPPATREGGTEGGSTCRSRWTP